MSAASTDSEKLNLSVGRAAQLLQDIFFMMREKTFHSTIRDIEIDNNKLLITYKSMFNPSIQKFPDHVVNTEKLLLSKLDSGQLKKMVLSSLWCNEAIAYLWEIVEELFQGTNVTMLEQALKIKDQKERLRTVGRKEHNTAATFAHFVIRVESPDTQAAWILDPTGAQFSIFEPCRDEASYMEQNCVEKQEAYSPGTHFRAFKNIADTPGVDGLSSQISFAIVDCIRDALGGWKKLTGLPLPDLFRHVDYERLRKELMQCIEKALDQFVEEADYGAKYEVARKCTKDTSKVEIMDMISFWFEKGIVRTSGEQIPSSSLDPDFTFP